MKRVYAALAVISLSALVSNANAEGVKIKLVNKSNFAIHEMYFSPTKQSDWGADQLRDETIEKNESFELRSIPVGKYDIKLVDEDGDACVVEAVKIAESEDVVIDDKLLVGCQAHTDQEEEGGESDE